MRRKDREITDSAVLKPILDAADVCRIAFAGEEPYMVAMNFGYVWNEKLLLYFHCAKQGRKLELIRNNGRVCFQLDTDHKLMQGETACHWGMGYKSIVGYGTISIVEAIQEKRIGLDAIMRHYCFEGEPSYEKSIFDETAVLRLEVSEMTGKAKG